MTTQKNAIRETVSSDDQERAREAATAFKRQLEANQVDIVELKVNGYRDAIEVPRLAFELFEKVLSHVAAGDMVTIVPQGHKLTTKQAADFLNVSRPFLIKAYLDTGRLTFRNLNKHRRIDFQDLTAFKAELDQEAQTAMDELVALSQGLGEGY